MTKTIITAKRPNGQIELVDVSDKHPVGINDKLFARMQAATKDAGRGELLSYSVEDIDDRTPAEVAWDAVERLYGQATVAADYSAAKSILLAKQADELAAQWHANYPAESAARAAAEQERRAEIANGPIARAMSEMRD